MLVKGAPAGQADYLSACEICYECISVLANQDMLAGLILGSFSANERWRYFVMTSLIGWVEA